MQVLEVRHDNKRPAEYLKAIEELKQHFTRSIQVVNKLHDLGLKYGLSKQEIRADIERALAGVVSSRQLRSLLPLELKNANKIRIPKKPPQNVAAYTAAKRLTTINEAILLEWRGKIVKMGNRRVVCVPAYLKEHATKLEGRELKIQII